MSTRKYLAGVVLAAEVGGVFSSNSSLAIPPAAKMDKKVYEKIFRFFSEDKKLVWFIVSCLGIVTFVAVIIYFLNKPSTLALDSNKSKPLTFDYTGKEDLSFLKGKIKSGDTLKVTFKEPDALEDVFKKHLGKLADEVAPFFLSFDSEGEAFRFFGYPENGETTISLKCYDLCDFLSRGIAEYEKILTLEEYNKYLERFKICATLLPHIGASFGNDKYEFERLVIGGVLGLDLIDSSYTRASFKEEERRVKSLFENVQNFGDEKVIDVVQTNARAHYLLRDIILISINKDGKSEQFSNGRGDGTASLNVESQPHCIDLVKYMLIADGLVEGKSYDKGAYCVFLDKIILYTFSVPNIITGGKLEQDKKLKKELFSYWLDLKNKKEPTEVAFKLVGFLKKFLKEDEVKTIKDKYLKDGKEKSDGRFLKLFEENSELGVSLDSVGNSNKKI